MRPFWIESLQKYFQRKFSLLFMTLYHDGTRYHTIWMHSYSQYSTYPLTTPIFGWRGGRNFQLSQQMLQITPTFMCESAFEIAGSGQYGTPFIQCYQNSTSKIYWGMETAQVELKSGIIFSQKFSGLELTSGSCWTGKCHFAAISQTLYRTTTLLRVMLQFGLQVKMRGTTRF